ncbi:aspartic peptidase domain-containing protein [Nemania sp. FL0916]|nr:aspartic peptidase domain-containing protein [Nemania sp. FL0916]
MIIVYFLPLILIDAFAYGMSCGDIKPLAFPITDIQILSDNPQSLTKGVLAGIGTPPQNIAVLPWPELNNTWIYDQQPFCDPSIIFNSVICRIRRGNLYSEVDSSSYRKEDDIPSVGGASVETQGQGAELGIGQLLRTSVAVQDRLSIGPTRIAEAFPFGVPRLSWDHGYTINHAMGLGSNSTLLNTLVQAGQIGSRVWSIFWGRMWVDPEDAMDGTLVLGGYDSQKVISKNYTQPLDFSNATGCWTGMKVHISGVQLNARTGDNVELLPPNTAIATCLVPQRQLLLEGPGVIVENFENSTGMSSIGRSFGLHWSSYLYENTDIFDGDMTISLSSGLDVRIPNSQYLVPYVDVDRNGTRIFNTSRREFLFNGVGDNPSTLGRYFLTGAYLMVDHDAGTFTMWAANPTPESTLVSVVPTGSTTSMRTDCGNANGTDPSPDGHGPATDKGAAPMNNGAILSPGSIAGIAIGAVAALAIIGVGAYFLYKRKRRDKMGSTGPVDVSPVEKYGHEQYWHEVPAQTSRYALPAELDGGIRPELTADERHLPVHTSRIYEM